MEQETFALALVCHCITTAQTISRERSFDNKTARSTLSCNITNWCEIQ